VLHTVHYTELIIPEIWAKKDAGYRSFKSFCPCHMFMTKRMTCQKKPEYSGFFAAQIQKKFLKKMRDDIGVF